MIRHIHLVNVTCPQSARPIRTTQERICRDGGSRLDM
jgi:hypothetical protein